MRILVRQRLRNLEGRIYFGPGKDHIILFEHQDQLEVRGEIAFVALSDDVGGHQVSEVQSVPPASSLAIAHGAGVEDIASTGPAAYAVLTTLVVVVLGGPARPVEVAWNQQHAAETGLVACWRTVCERRTSGRIPRRETLE